MDNSTKVSGIRSIRISSIAIAVVLGAVIVAAPPLVSAVWAQTDTHTDGTHEGGKGGKGGGSGGHEDGTEEGHEEGAGGKGGKGQGQVTAGKGTQGAKGGHAGTDTGRPVWAKEGIPEVELGRLNVARSPEHVLGRAYDEALSAFTPAIAAFYSQNLDQMVEQLSLHWDETSLIDSPLQNLALFEDALDGTSILRTVGITTDNGTLLAAFLGTASDKTIPVTRDTALAISAILGHPISLPYAEVLAANAERIRISILAGHG